VIILSAALDLVGPNIPKGVVLLCDVIPSFGTKLVAPYFIHIVPYPLRILAFVAISTIGMLLIALTPDAQDAGNIAVKMVGVMLASLSSGGGELSFLGLTHYYGHISLASWSSGTGGAGLIGAGAYAVATTSIGLSVRTSLLVFSFLPLIMLASFFFILPREPLNNPAFKNGGYEEIEPETEDEPPSVVPDNEDATLVESEALLAYSETANSTASLLSRSSRSSGTWKKFRANLKRATALFFP
jgi:battenin